MSFTRGWDPLRPGDFGALWEHLVLEHLQAHFPDTPVSYWRDRLGREVDFVIARHRDDVDAIECKWDQSAFDGSAMTLFRKDHPNGRNYLVTPGDEMPFDTRYRGLAVRVCSPAGLRR